MGLVYDHEEPDERGVTLRLTIDEYKTLSALRFCELRGDHHTRKIIDRKFRSLDERYKVNPRLYKDRLD